MALVVNSIFFTSSELLYQIAPSGIRNPVQCFVNGEVVRTSMRVDLYYAILMFVINPFQTTGTRTLYVHVSLLTSLCVSY